MTKKNQKTTEHTIADRRDEIAKRMHIMQAWNRSYHVIEISGGDGEPIKAWPGPFNRKRAAELMLEDMIEHHVRGSLDDLEHIDLVAKYEREGAFVDILESHGGVNDPRALARLLIQEQPWTWNSCGGNRDAEIPF